MQLRLAPPLLALLCVFAPGVSGQEVATYNGPEPYELSTPRTFVVTGDGISRLQIGAATIDGAGEGTASFLPGAAVFFDTSAATPSSTGGYGTLDVGRGVFEGTRSLGTVEHSGGTVDLNGGVFQLGVEGGMGNYLLSGSASLTASSIMIGHGSGGSGYLTLQGASQFAIGTPEVRLGHIFIGNGGEGTISQEGAGSVVSLYADSGVSIGRRADGGVGTGEYHLGDGTLTIGSSGEVTLGVQGDATGRFTQDGGTSTFQSPVVVVGDRGNGTFAINGGTATVEGILGLARSNRADAVLELNGGTLQVQSLGVGAGFAQVGFAGGTLKITDQFESDETISLQGFLEESTTSILDTSGNPLWLGHLTGDGNLVKQGNGELRILQANMGSLDVAGGLATFASGLIAAVTVRDGAAFGASGPLTIGDLTLEGGALLFAISGLDDYGSLSLEGSFTGTGTLSVLMMSDFGLNPHTTFNLINAGSWGVNSGDLVFDLPDVDGFTWDTSDFFSTGSISLNLTAIPEPSTYAIFAGLGALGLAAWRRRRQLPC